MSAGGGEAGRGYGGVWGREGGEIGEDEIGWRSGGGGGANAGRDSRDVVLGSGAAQPSDVTGDLFVRGALTCTYSCASGGKGAERASVMPAY